MKFCVESDRQNGYVSPFALEAYADDRTGLLPGEIVPIPEVAPTAKLTVAELALDFSPLSTVNREFVLRHGLFGKSQRDLETQNHFGDWWGARRGGKRTKSYFKDEICGHRLEVTMKSQFLAHYEIKSIFDLGQLVQILPGKHIFFGHFDEQNLIRRLRLTRDATATLRILRQVNALEGDLLAQLTYLRQREGLKNTRRFLTPLPENRLVFDALKDWAATWPTTPAKLEKRK